MLLPAADLGVRWDQQATMAQMNAGAIEKGSFVYTEAFDQAMIHSGVELNS